MAEPKKLTVRTVEAFVKAHRGRGEHFLWDSEIRGFGLRVRDQRASYVLQYRNASNKTRRMTLGDAAVLKPEKAREHALELLVKIKRGDDPAIERRERRRAESGVDTVRAIVDEFMKRHVDAARLRSRDEIERIFNKYVIPEWGDRQVHEIGVLDVTRLLDKIADENGLVMADRVLAAIRKLFNWHAARDDRFNSPIRRGMARTKPRERARTRILSDDEIRLIWACAGQLGTYGALVQVLFLSAQRREEVAGMARSEINAEDVWAIDPEKYKTKVPHFVPLPDRVRQIIDAQPVVRRSDLVFTTNGKTSFSGFSKAKRKLDELILETLREQARERGENPAKVQPLPRWTLHDIRRTAKTLMQRASVRPDISERVLGHVIPGVAGVYDRHSYLEEKRDALRRLAALIDLILNRPEMKVVSLRPASDAPAA